MFLKLFTFYEKIALLLMIFSLNSYANVFNPELFNSGDVIDSNKINANFNNIKTTLKNYYNIDISFNTFNENEIIEKNLIKANFEAIKVITPSYDIPELSTIIKASEFNNAFSLAISSLESSIHHQSCSDIKNDFSPYLKEGGFLKLDFKCYFKFLLHRTI